MPALTILCFAYSISLFYRGMIAVIAPELAADLGLDASGLGMLSSTFFISFAVAQVPVGIALDRYGARLTIAVCLWFSVLGTALLSMAGSPFQAFAGQALIGLGCAPVFTATMLFIGRHYTPEQFSYMTALVLAIGSFGDIFGTAPLALLADWLGWRWAMLVPLMLAALTACGCWFGLPIDRPEGEQPSLALLLQGMARVLTLRELWPIFPMVFASYAVLMAIRGLWSGPYLAQIFALGAAERGVILLLMSIAMALGTFLLGALDRRLQQTKTVVIGSALLTSVSLLLLTLWPQQSAWLAMIAFIGIGLCGFNYPLLISHCRTFLASSYHGRGMAVLSALSFIGVALVQGLSGWMIETSAVMGVAPTEQFRYLFLLLLVVLLLATLAYGFSRSELRPKQSCCQNVELRPEC
ncbi:MAG: MFS transporter [Motiliproteus sp.]